MRPYCRAYRAALDSVGLYRKMHPKADLYSASTINAALKGFKSDHPTMRVENIPNKKGEITVLHLLPKKDRKIATLPVYVSIKKFDPIYFGVPDPGSNYTLGIVDTLNETTPFGQAKTGLYPKN